MDTFVPPLYQCIETRSIEVFDYCLSRFNLFIISETFATKVFSSGPNRWKSLGANSGL
jgi:hypothetical protein